MKKTKTRINWEKEYNDEYEKHNETLLELQEQKEKYNKLISLAEELVDCYKKSFIGGIVVETCTLDLRDRIMNAEGDVFKVVDYTEKGVLIKEEYVEDAELIELKFKNWCGFKTTVLKLI